jgi:hypothetical protein
VRPTSGELGLKPAKFVVREIRRAACTRTSTQLPHPAVALEHPDALPP